MIYVRKVTVFPRTFVTDGRKTSNIYRSERDYTFYCFLFLHIIFFDTPSVIDYASPMSLGKANAKLTYDLRT